MSPHVDVSVVIGFKDWGLERLALSIQSIQDSFAGGITGEVIVSDYGSADPLMVSETVEPLGALCVRTETAGEWSRSRALNAGIRAASGRQIFTTDADMVFTPETFPVLCSWLDAHSGNAVVLQCRDLPSDYSHEAVARHGSHWALFERRAKLRPRWGMGGLFGVDRASIDAVGGYDERMHTYGGEDLDFAQRIRRSGVPITWIEDRRVRMYHVWHPSTHAAIKKQAGGVEAVSHNQKILREDKSWVRNVIEGATSTDGFPLVSFLTVLDDDSMDDVEEAVDSVLAQTVDRVESVVVARRRVGIEETRLAHLDCVKLVLVDDDVDVRNLYAAGLRAVSGYWTAFQFPGHVSVIDRAEVLLNHIRAGQVGAWSAVGLVDVEAREGHRLMPCNPAEATSRSWIDGLGAASLFLRTDVLRRLVEPVGGRLIPTEFGQVIAGADLQLMQAQRALIGVWTQNADEADVAQIEARESLATMRMSWAGLASRQDETFALSPKDVMELAPADQVVRSGVVQIPGGVDACLFADSMDASTRVWTETHHDETVGSSTIRLTGMSRRDVNRVKLLVPDFQPTTVWASQETGDTVSLQDPTTEVIGSILERVRENKSAGQVVMAFSADREGLNGVEELLLPGGRVSHILTDRIDVHVLVQPIPSDRASCADLWAELVRRRNESAGSVYLVRSYTLSAALGLLTMEAAPLTSSQEREVK